jgi:hypothetical protein
MSRTKAKGTVYCGDNSGARQDVAIEDRASSTASLPSTSTLSDLAARINAEHEATIAGFRRSLEHAVTVGELLIEAKGRLKHGQWLPWLGENTRIDARLAQVYMRIARNREQIEAAVKCVDISHLLTVTDALALLSPPRGVAGETQPIEHEAAQQQASCIAHTVEIIPPIPEKKPQSPVLQSISVEHYTPARFIEAARKVLEQIDLDPASCEQANKTVGARKFYDAKTDGLKQKWRGRVWLNPPYNGAAQPFIEKLIDSIASKDVKAAIVLLNANATGTKWFRPLWKGLLCFCYDRIRFDGPGDRSSPTNGSVLVYLGPRADAFAEQFQQFGAIVSLYKKIAP